MTDWIEHNGGPQPVDDAVWVERDDRYYNIECAPAKAFEWGRKRFRFRILNQHLIDAARLEGIRLGLEAAVKEIAEREEAASNCPDGGSEWLRTDHMKADIRALNPDTIAKEADQ